MGGFVEPFGEGRGESDVGGKALDEGGPAVHLFVEDYDVCLVGDGNGDDGVGEHVAAESHDAFYVGPVHGDRADGAVSEAGGAAQLGGVDLDLGAVEGNAVRDGVRCAGGNHHSGAG